MATQITTITAGYISIQAGHGVPSHVAPKGSQYTDVDTATIYYNKNGISDWQLDGGNSFTGGTVVGLTTFLNGLSATTISATTFYGDGSNLTGISTQDTFVTGGTYTNGTTTFTNNTGGTFTVSGFYTGYTAPIDVRVTGGTYSNSTGIATYTNNTGGTFNVTGFFKPSDDIYTTGLTFNPSTYDLNIIRNDGTSFTQNLAILATDMTITGGTYNSGTGTATFTNNTGGTFSVSGFLTGMTDTYTTGFTYNNNTLTIKRNAGQPDLSVLINTMTGLTINGSISATTYLNLPIDVTVTGGTYSNGTTTFTNNTGGTFVVNGYYTGYTAPIDVTVTGGTYSSGTATFTNNTGGTFTVSGFKTDDIYTTGLTFNNNILTLKQNNNQADINVLVNNFSGLTVNGSISATTISATTFYGNGSNLTGISTQDTFVTGGTYNSGSILFTNNTGGTFNVTGLYTGYTAPIDVTVTGGTYSNGTATFTNNTGGTFTVTGFKTNDIFVTGGTYSNSTGITTYTNNTGGTFTVSGFFKSSDDIYTTGLTFNAGTYDLSVNRNDGTSFTQNLAILATDMTITGGTYNSSTGIATFTNNTGGTFNVSGFLTGMTDTYTTGFTYSNNTLTIKRNASQPDLSVLINTMTGLTVGNLVATGSTSFTGGLTANTISATTYYNLPTDIRTTGITISSGSVAFNRNDNMSAYTVSFSGVNIDVISDNINKRITFSASTGGSSLPTLNQAQIFIGDTLNTAQARSVSGDISLNYSGLTTIQPNVVTYSKMQTVSQESVLGSTNLTGGTVEEIPMIDGYIATGATVSSLLEDINNWDINGVYIGTTITGTYQGQSHYNYNYWFTAIDDNIWIRLIRG